MAYAPSETAQSAFPDGREILGTSREGALRSDSLRLALSSSPLDGPTPGSLVDRRGPVVLAFAQASKSASR